MRYFATTLFLFVATATFSGCGSSDGTVTVQSNAFTTATGLSQFSVARPIENPANLTSVTDFKFCINKVKLENEDGKIEQKDGNDDITFQPGLIDVSTGTEKVWGQLQSIPTGFKLRRIKFSIHRDPALCGVEHSISYNGTTTQQDIEVKFRFNPAIELTAGDVLKLDLTPLLTAIQAAGSLNDTSFKQALENAEGTATAQ